MKSLIISIVFMFSTPMTWAGTADRSLDCKSASGRTTLKGVVPGDSLNHDFTFAIDGHSFDYLWETRYPQEDFKNSEVQALGSLRGQKPSFHFVTLNNNNEAILTFIALPQTIRVSTTSGGEAGNFSALVVGKDPRNTSAITPTIQVNCNYTYEL